MTVLSTPVQSASSSDAHSESQKQASGGFESVAGLRQHQLTAGGGPLSIYEAGDVGRPTVVMLHGAMYDESRFIWDQLFPYLSSSYHVFAVDTPRHGQSRPWDGKLDHSRLMDILDDGLEQLGLQRFSLIGLSMGGGLAIGYSSLHPDKLQSLVLFEPGGLSDTTVSQHFIVWLYTKIPGFHRMLSKKYAKGSDAEIMKMLESVYVGGTKPRDPQRLLPILKDEIQGKFLNGESDMDDWQSDLIGPLRMKWNLLDRIPLLRCPSLWLRGAESELVKQEEMERAVALAQSGGMPAQLELFQNAGHLLPLEQPELANAAVKRFLDETTE